MDSQKIKELLETLQKIEKNDISIIDPLCEHLNKEIQIYMGWDYQEILGVNRYRVQQILSKDANWQTTAYDTLKMDYSNKTEQMKHIIWSFLALRQYLVKNIGEVDDDFLNKLKHVDACYVICKDDILSDDDCTNTTYKTILLDFASERRLEVQDLIGFYTYNEILKQMD